MFIFLLIGRTINRLWKQIRVVYVKHPVGSLYYNQQVPDQLNTFANNNPSFDFLIQNSGQVINGVLSDDQQIHKEPFDFTNTTDYKPPSLNIDFYYNFRIGANSELEQKSSNQSNMDTGSSTFMEVAYNPVPINCQVNNNRT